MIAVESFRLQSRGGSPSAAPLPSRVRPAMGAVSSGAACTRAHFHSTPMPMDTPLIRRNRLRRLLAEGTTPIGVFLIEFRQVAVLQILADCGFDFVIIDNEHGVFDIESIAELSRAARLIDLMPIVRIPDHAYPWIAQALDAGAIGIMAPRIETPAQVAAVVRSMKYPPQGARGNAMGLGYMEFRSGPVPEVLRRENEETFLVVQIETRGAVENLEAIMATPGVDAALVGPNDLAIALGVPGETDGPEVRAVIERVIDVGRRTGTASAVHMRDLDAAVRWIGRGVRMLSCRSETILLADAGRAVVERLRQGTAG
jgi:2-keto-3-deoxy-L-rhamnonate aldolase RhmA